MARVRVVRYVRQGSRMVPVKRVTALAPLLRRAAIEASATQLRVVAEEGRELLLDRLFAADPQAPAQIIANRPPKERRPEIPGAVRGPFSHRPLTQAWVSRKAREGLDGRKLIATGDYMEGIEVFRGVQQESGVYYMVRPARRKHRPSGLTLRRIARIHEFGSATIGIPARPHWGPVTRDVIRRARQLGPTVRAVALRRALRQVA